MDWAGFGLGVASQLLLHCQPIEEIAAKSRIQRQAVLAAKPKKRGDCIVVLGYIKLYNGCKNRFVPKVGLPLHKRTPAKRCNNFLCNGTRGKRIARPNNRKMAFSVGSIEQRDKLNRFPSQIKDRDGCKELFGEMMSPSDDMKDVILWVMSVRVCGSVPSKRMSSR